MHETEKKSLQRNNSIFSKFLLVFQPGKHSDSYMDISCTISCIFYFWWVRKSLLRCKFGTSASGKLSASQRCMDIEEKQKNYFEP